MKQNSIYSGDLILVNASHQFRTEDKSILVPVDDQFSDILVNKKLADAYQNIMMKIHAQNKIVPVSGYRSHDEQTALFDSSLKENGKEFTYKYVALPDHSEHQTGLALDVGINQENIDFIRPDFPYDGIAQEFRNAAPKYGLIERYGKEKEEITGISHEPWHFRYVGCPHAEYITEHNLCLEEYIDIIKKYTKENPLKYHHYNIYFEKTITSLDTVCSGNNVDGFIVTKE